MDEARRRMIRLGRNGRWFACKIRQDFPNDSVRRISLSDFVAGARAATPSQGPGSWSNEWLQCQRQARGPGRAQPGRVIVLRPMEAQSSAAIAYFTGKLPGSRATVGRRSDFRNH